MPRYLSACEALWRMFAYDIHGRHPSVERLVVHLPNMNRVIFSEEANLDGVLNNPSALKTMLTEWFVANHKHRSARSLTYLEFPTQWVWNASDKLWTKRKQQQKACQQDRSYLSCTSWYWRIVLSLDVAHGCSWCYLL